MKKVLTLSLSILIFLISCENVSDFLFETDQTITVRSIENGAIYNGGASVPISIFFDRTIVPDMLSITIFDDEGVNWGATEVSIPTSEEEFPTSFLVPDALPEGRYIFHIRVYENEQEISFKEIIIFKTDSDYVIEQLLSTPNETEAGNDVLVRAFILYPTAGDPFLRWSVNGNLLKEGLLSQGLDSLHWLAEDENGLYKIRLEVFPESVSSAMVSSVFASTEIVVTDNPLMELDSLRPEEAYSLLYHFNGSLESVSNSEFSVVETEQPKVGSLNNRLVYEFSETSGIVVTGSIIPEQSGVVTPFSVNGRVSLSKLASSASFLQLSENGENLFSVDVSGSGNLIFSAGDQQSVSLFALTEMTDFSLQIIPFDDLIEIRWFYNGHHGGSDVLSAEFPLISNTQKLIIGGDGAVTGAPLILDELGFYVGDMADSSVDSAQFSRVKEYVLKERLIDAEGVDNKDGYRMIEPGSEFFLSNFPLSIRDTEIVLSFPSADTDDSWKVTFKDASGNLLSEVSSVYSTEEIDSNTGLVSKKLRLSLEFNEQENVFELKRTGELHKVLNTFNPGDMLSLFLETNVENKSSYPLDFYIIFTTIGSVVTEMMVPSEDVEKLL